MRIENRLPGFAQCPRIAGLLVLTLVVFLTGLMSALTPQRAEAIPAFARKYSVSCMTCHVAFPQLNSFGRTFRQNGYRMAGDPGIGPWEDKSIPLSIIANLGLVSTAETTPAAGGGSSKMTTTNFRHNLIELQLAGTLAPHISYHFDSGFDPQTGTLGTGQSFVQFDDLIGEGGLNVKGGSFDAEIPYMSQSRRMTEAEYLNPAATLDGTGIELNGHRSGWTYAGAVINSERTMGAPGAKNLNTFENAYAWLMRDVGEHAVAVRVYRDRQDPRLETATASASTQVDASALIRLPRVVVVPAYSHQKLADTDTDNTIQTGGLECNVLLDPTARWMLTGRYEQQHVTSSDGSPADNLRLATANLSYYVSINAKVGLDYSRISDHLAATHTDVMQAFFFVGY